MLITTPEIESEPLVSIILKKDTIQLTVDQYAHKDSIPGCRSWHNNVTYEKARVKRSDIGLWFVLVVTDVTTYVRG
jgi:hypothetical protein